jgi:hypothetical protein
MYIIIIHTKCFNALTGIQATTIYSILQQSRKATVYHSGRHVTNGDVVFRDIKTTTVTQMRDVHIRDKIIKDCILLGSPLTVGMFSSRIVSCLHPAESCAAQERVSSTGPELNLALCCSWNYLYTPQ